MKKFILFFLCGFATLLSGSDPDSDALFSQYDLDAMLLPLDDTHALQLHFPKRFRYAFSDANRSVILWEFTLDTENIDNWTELLAIYQFSNLFEDYENFVKLWTMRICGNTHEVIEFQNSGNIAQATTMGECNAVIMPENIPIPGKRELYRWKFAQGDQGSYIVQYVIRFDENISSKEAERLRIKSTALIDEMKVIDSFDDFLK